MVNQTANNSQVGLNFHSLNQEYQIQFNRINKIMMPDGGLNSGKSMPSANSSSFQQQVTQSQSQTRHSQANVVINPNWRKNMQENQPRYSDDFSAARALSQGGHIMAQQQQVQSTKNNNGGGGSNPRGNIYNSRINMPSKKSQKRKKSTGVLSSSIAAGSNNVA